MSDAIKNHNNMQKSFALYPAQVIRCQKVLFKGYKLEKASWNVPCASNLAKRRYSLWALDKKKQVKMYPAQAFRRKEGTVYGHKTRKSKLKSTLRK